MVKRREYCGQLQRPASVHWHPADDDHARVRDDNSGQAALALTCLFSAGSGVVEKW